MTMIFVCKHCKPCSEHELMPLSAYPPSPGISIVSEDTEWCGQITGPGRLHLATLICVLTHRADAWAGRICPQ